MNAAVPVIGSLTALAVGLIALAYGIVDAILFFRAKGRARVVLAAARDPVLGRLAATLDERNLDDFELLTARDAIDHVLGGLQTTDRRQIKQGLYQNNRTGQRRFIYDLIVG